MFSLRDVTQLGSCLDSHGTPEALTRIAMLACSLMNSIIHEEARPTKGTAEEVSTVGIELLRHRLGDVRVELYDCAGQIDYAGMRQIFLSRRALYLLVWDVKKCHGKHGDDLDQVGGVDFSPLFFPRTCPALSRPARFMVALPRIAT